MAFRYITNPESNRKVNIQSKLGQRIIGNYLQRYQDIVGGGEQEPCKLQVDCKVVKNNCRSSDNPSRPKTEGSKTMGLDVIDKAGYKEWEKRVMSSVLQDTATIIDLINTTIPTDGNPVLAQQRKVMVVVDPLIMKEGVRVPLSSLVTASTQDTLSRDDIPQRKKTRLFHFGDGKISNVKWGYKWDDDTDDNVTFCATDFGGLTNYRLKPGDSTSFMTPGQITLSADDDLDEKTKEIYENWLASSKKDRFYGNVNLYFSEWVKSVQTYLEENSEKYVGANIEFATISSLRILFTAQDIIDSVGEYYIRNWKGDDDLYAETVKQTEGIYGSISFGDRFRNNFITPNINLDNIRNEYSLINIKHT